jgi:hypothetical protein
MDQKLEGAVEAIIDGARLHHLGCFLEKQKLQCHGIEKIDEGMKVIDEEFPEKRDILIPLLEHKDPSVRVAIASALLVSRPELALPVLNDIADNCITIARRTAGIFLDFHNIFGPGIMSICRPDPRYAIPEEYRYKGEPLIPE